jgi:uncharacterized membrane protein
MKKTLEESIATSKTPRIMDYFSQGFNLVFKQVGLFFGVMMIMLLISIAASQVPGLDFAQSLLVQPLLMMGIFVVADKINYQEGVTFSNFFDGFNQVGPILLSNLLRGLAVLPALAIMAYGYVEMFGMDNLKAMVLLGRDAIDPTLIQFSGLSFLFILIGLLLALIISLFFIFTLPMIRFRGLGATQAMSASFKLTGKHFPNFILFGLLAFVINLAGALLLLVGLIITIPATYCAISIAFDDLIEAREVEGDDEDTIMEHFIS